jgi:hypothetical protein
MTGVLHVLSQRIYQNIAADALGFDIQLNVCNPLGSAAILKSISPNYLRCLRYRKQFIILSSPVTSPMEMPATGAFILACIH